MSYVIVKFERPSLSAAALYVVNGEAAGVDARNAPFAYTLSGFGDACSMAAEAARLFGHSAAYAVFNVTGLTNRAGVAYAFSSGLVPDQLQPLSTLCALAPVYVPAPSSGLWARYGSTWERLPFMLGNASPAGSPAVAPAPAAIRFEVRAGLVGTDRDNWSAVMDFDNGKDAGAWVSANRASFTEAGKALVIVKVEASAVASDWRERERERLEDGTYTPLPGDWAAHIAEFYPDHFAHVAQSDKRKVAFTESESSGERDKQKALSASAYVDRFFGDNAPFYWLSERRSRFLSDMLGDSVKPLFAPLGDADAIEAIYRETEGGACHGCMSYSAGHYSSPFHPVRVYAMGGDITIAFLRACSDTDEDSGVDLEATWDGSGTLLARCLVWPEGKEYGRVYGDTTNARMLRTALEAQGYSSGDLCGAKIAKVPHSHSYVMPYLDIGGGEVEDMGSYFIVGGDISATQADGLLEEPGICCDHCGDNYPEDEMALVYTGRGYTGEWCEGCREYHAVYTDHDGEYISSDCISSYIPSGCTYPESISDWGLEEVGAAYVESRGEYCEDFFVCDECGEAFHSDDEHSHEGQSVCAGCLSDLEEAAEAEAAEAAEAAPDAAPIAA